MILRKKLGYCIQNFVTKKSVEIMFFFLASYFNANLGVHCISVTEIQTNLHIWTRCNRIQQYSPFVIYAMRLMFNKMADDVPSEQRTNQSSVPFCFSLLNFNIMIKYNKD